MSILDKASLIQIPSGYKSTKLYSLRPSNGTGDFTFARSSSATRVNSEGLIETASVVSTTELVTNGDFATDSNWTKGTGWTISGGKANVASGSDGSALSQDISKVGVVNRVTFTISNYTGSGFVRLRTGNSSQVQDFSANGTYSFEVIPTTTTFSFARYMNGSLSIDNVSVKEVFENDVPRLDYSGGASCASLLLEPQATNLLPYSEDFSQSYWGKSGLSIVSNNATSPDGSLNASKLVENTSNSVHRIFNGSGLSVSGNVSMSVFAKKGGRDFIRLTNNLLAGAFFDLNNGVVLGVSSGITAKIEDFGNGWYRCSITQTGVANERLIVYLSNNGIDTSYQGDGSSGVYLYGAQLEQGSYPTSYIPSNSGSSTTRSADVCNNAGTSATFNDSEGVLFAEISRQKGSVLTTALSINNGSLANSVNFYYYSTNVLYFDIFSGVTTVSGNVNIDTYNLNKIALKYKSGDISLYANGLKLITNTNAISLSGLNELDFNFGAGNQPFYGKCKQLMVFNEALSDEELSDLTGQVNLSFNNLAEFYGYTIL